MSKITLDDLAIMIKKQFDDVYRRFDQIDRKFDDVYRRFDQIDARFDDVYRRFDQIDAKFDELTHEFRAHKNSTNETLVRHDTQIHLLEKNAT